MIGNFESISVRYLDDYIRRDKTLIIDIRDKDEYDNGHVQGAINVPYEIISNNEYSFPKDHDLILYCERGGLSNIAARQLSRMGYQVKTVVGGINAYKGKIYY